MPLEFTLIQEIHEPKKGFVIQFFPLLPFADRYYELEEKYGRLDPLAQVELKPRRTVRLKVVFDDYTKLFFNIMHFEYWELKPRRTVRLKVEIPIALSLG